MTTTTSPAPSVTGPRLGPLGWARFAWRQLTSMRTALVLLLLLALAAIPGSAFPQRRIDAAQSAQFIADNPTLGRWLDRLGMFDVYSTPWFAAIYLLLFISLVGCVIPRARLHWVQVRARPPRAPRR
ncbi:MAG: cytochrome c biogenesis protein ResB, partial [Phycicoccus sp.]